MNNIIEIPVASKPLGPFIMKVLLTEDIEKLDWCITRAGELTKDVMILTTRKGSITRRSEGFPECLEAISP
jgi:hypothetical protein